MSTNNFANQSVQSRRPIGFYELPTSSAIRPKTVVNSAIAAGLTSRVSSGMTQANRNAPTDTYQSDYQEGYGGPSGSQCSALGTARALATPTFLSQGQPLPTSSSNATAPASNYGPTSLVNHVNEDFSLTKQQADFRHECDKCNASFKRLGDLKRHYKKHFPVTRIFHCKVLGCDKNGENGFYRRDKLMDHMRSAHPELVPQG